MKERKREIYIMLTDTGTWLNSLIKKYTDAPYNHVSIGLDESLDSLYSFGRKKPKNPFFGGFVKEDVVTGTYRYFPNTKCVIYKMNVTEKEYRKIRKIIRKFESKKNTYRFNFIGLLAVAIDKPFKRKTAYFCSQFVAEVFKRAGIKLIEKDSSLVKPDDFRRIPNIELVYEGRLYDYQKVMEKMSGELELDLESTPRYHLFIKPIKKTVRFVNPLFYYQYAVERSSVKQEK